jgi:hypothetical protein
VYVFRLYSTSPRRILIARLKVGQPAAEIVALPAKPKNTGPLVDRVLQLLSFCSIVFFAALAAMHIWEVRHDG